MEVVGAAEAVAGAAAAGEAHMEATHRAMVAGQAVDMPTTKAHTTEEAHTSSSGNTATGTHMDMHTTVMAHAMSAGPKTQSASKTLNKGTRTPRYCLVSWEVCAGSAV